MTDGLVGKVGRVVVRVRGGELPGEVSLIVAGMPEAYLAYSDEPVPVGRDVLVVRDRGDRGVDVVPWDYRVGGPDLPDLLGQSHSRG